MPKYNPLTKGDLRERIKEIEERIRAMDRRDKMMGDLKKWMLSRKLTPIDLAHMIRQLKPKRAAKPATSKNPLQRLEAAEQPKRRFQGSRESGMVLHNGKLIPAKGDPDFRRAIREARMDNRLNVDALGKKIGVSGATISNWEQGRNVPKDAPRKALLKVLELPMHLGAEATATAAAALTNGKAAG